MSRVAWLFALVLLVGCAKRVETVHPEPVAARPASMADLQFEAVMAAMPPLQLEVLAQPVPPLTTSNGVTIAGTQTITGTKTFSAAPTLSAGAACGAATATCLLTSSINAATATSSVGAFTLKASNAVDANDRLLDIKKSDGTTIFSVDLEGDIPSMGSIGAMGSIVQMYGRIVFVDNPSNAYIANTYPGTPVTITDAEGLRLGYVGSMATCNSSDMVGTIATFSVPASGNRTRLCLCTSDNAGSPAYAWSNMATGSVGNTTTCPAP